MVVLMLIFAENHGGAVMSLSPGLLIVLFASAILPIGLAHVAYYTSINRLGVALTSGLVQLQPFCVAAVSVPLLKELMGWQQWLGGAIAVSGAVLMLRAQQLISRAARERAALNAVSADHDFDDLPIDADVAACASPEVEPKPGEEPAEPAVKA
jgi:drug/metabolite transporter (DMT)-like permease